MQAVTSNKKDLLVLPVPKNHKLAIETINQLHRFLSMYNESPSTRTLINYFSSEPLTESKCRIALSFLPTGSCYDGGNFKISVCRCEVPYFEVKELPRLDGSNKTIKYLIVSETAKKALLEFCVDLSAKELEEKRNLKTPLIYTNAKKNIDDSCWNFCNLF